MKHLFVCSRPIIDSKNEYHRHLLGILLQDDNGKYSFEYKLTDSVDTDYLLLPIFPIKNKIYGDRDTHLLLDDYLPSENDTNFIKTILKQSNLSEYDEWEWLKAFDTADDNSETILYETLPSDVICHADISEYTNSNTDESDEFIEYENDDYENDEDEIINEIAANDEMDETDNKFDDNEFDDLFDDIFSPDSDIADDLFDDDFDDYEMADNDVNKIESEPEKKQPVRIVTKTITCRVKRSNDLDDFIFPPPINPIDIIQQRIEQFEHNTKMREQQRKTESTSIT